jgi:hypothetical protein
MFQVSIIRDSPKNDVELKPITLKVCSDENEGGLKLVSIDRPSFNIEPRIFIFKFKGHHPLNSKNLFQRLTITKLALMNKITAHYKKLVAGR